MGRPEMLKDRKQKIQEMSASMTHNKIAEVLGMNRKTVSGVLRHRNPVRQSRISLLAALRRREAMELPKGCFNTYDMECWLV